MKSTKFDSTSDLNSLQNQVDRGVENPTLDGIIITDSDKNDDFIITETTTSIFTKYMGGILVTGVGQYKRVIDEDKSTVTLQPKKGGKSIVRSIAELRP